MADIQNQEDRRQLPIDQVGVSSLRYPIVVFDRYHEKQQTVATLSLSASLPQHFKGTHMSRFLEILNEHRGEMTMRTLPRILEDIRERLEADRAQMEVIFHYFIEKEAPISKATSLMDYECTFWGDLNFKNSDFILGVKVPITSLCPCSKEISDYGAHNQRGIVSIKVRPQKKEDHSFELIWLEELIEYAEQSASSPIYPLLKRPDERYVTMQAYDRPVFVEDIVRNVAEKLLDDSRVQWFSIHAENYESIHNHSAFAIIERSK